MSFKIHEKAAVGFDKAGDSYVRGRPDYPEEAIEFLVKEFQINSSSVVVDLGAGTGKFTKLIIPFCNQIIAVEPVEGMRKKFQSLFPEIKILNGSAEKIPLADQSVDIVIVAQAFHWFDGEKALKEIHRVLKPQGKICLLWNVRDESKEWVSEMSRIIEPFERGTPRYRSMNWKVAFDSTRLFSKLNLRRFKYTQVGDVETINDRIGSISFISVLGSEEKLKVLNQIRDLVWSHPDTKDSAKIELPYHTEVYCCERV